MGQFQFAQPFSFAQVEGVFSGKIKVEIAKILLGNKI